MDLERVKHSLAGDDDLKREKNNMIFVLEKD
jgi:hypothetical protein